MLNRPRTCALLPVLAILGACGSSSASGDARPAAPADAASASNDAATSERDAGPTDATPATTDGGEQGPRPPSGATLCKRGALSPKDVRDACKLAPNFAPVPTNGCDTAKTNGGRYELWCTATARYLWARIDTVRPGEPPLTCPMTPDVVLNANAPFAFTASGAGVGNAIASAGPPPVKLGTHPSVVLEATYPTGESSGTGNVWLMGLDGSCSRGNGDPDPVVFAGVSVTWP